MILKHLDSKHLTVIKFIALILILLSFFTIRLKEDKIQENYNITCFKSEPDIQTANTENIAL